MTKKKPKKKKKVKKTARKRKPKKKAKRKRPVKRRKRKPISLKECVREVTVRYGGVIRIASFENLRLSFEMTADRPPGVEPDFVCDYLKYLCSNQFYQEQIKQLESLPEEMRAELGDIRGMPPPRAAQTIRDFFKAYRMAKKPLTEKDKKLRIAEITIELKKLEPQIRAENRRLQRKKDIAGVDLSTRAELVDRRKILKKELKELRGKNGKRNSITSEAVSSN